jgi:predicted RNA-binding Zn-ribbon protein involved in translation (DUF1610 family)
VLRGPIGIGIAAVVVVVAVGVQVMNNRTTAFQCAQCGHTFSLSPVAAVLSPHSMGRKMVTCPKCGARDWATPVPKDG